MFHLHKLRWSVPIYIYNINDSHTHHTQNTQLPYLEVQFYIHFYTCYTVGLLMVTLK